jgi:hypothetical protein
MKGIRNLAHVARAALNGSNNGNKCRKSAKGRIVSTPEVNLPHRFFQNASNMPVAFPAHERQMDELADSRRENLQKSCVISVFEAAGSN